MKVFALVARPAVAMVRPSLASATCPSFAAALSRSFSSPSPPHGHSAPASSAAGTDPAGIGGRNFPVLPHPIYSTEEVKKVVVTHREPAKSLTDFLALGTVKTLRFGYDLVSGYSFTKRPTEKMLLTRMIFLETVAGVPGLVAGMTRHAQSLAMMRRDYGWINTLLEEAENERMHLLTFLELKQPGPMFRMAVLATQGFFWPLYFSVYLVAPTFAHRFVAYLEEEAVRTYTNAIEHVEAGHCPTWNSAPAPSIAITYWQLPAKATVLDVLYAIRADEANHRETNHILADTPKDKPNPVAGKRFSGTNYE